MKSFLIIGMGKFGHHLCENLLKTNHDIMIIDNREEQVADLVYRVTNVQIGDCTDPKVVKSLGVSNFDTVFVCLGNDFQNSLEITSLVKEMGAKKVISKADRDVHAKFLLKNGADEVIYPDRDIAETLARRCSSDHIFDYIELTPEYSIYEIAIPKDWIGKTIGELGVRQKYNINIIGIKTGCDTEDVADDRIDILPSPGYQFDGKEHLMIIGAEVDINAIVKKFKD